MLYPSSFCPFVYHFCFYSPYPVLNRFRNHETHRSPKRMHFIVTMHFTKKLFLLLTSALILINLIGITAAASESFASIFYRHFLSTSSRSENKILSHLQTLRSFSHLSLNQKVHQYTFDRCFGNSSTCVYPRTCQNGDFETCDLITDDYCYCLEDGLRNCTDSYECLYGDRCIRYGQYQVCVSCNVSDLVDEFVPVDEAFYCTGGSTPSPSPAPYPTDTPENDGTTGSPCTSSFDCISPRTCYDLDDGSSCSSSSFQCACIDISNFYCRSSEDCLSGDRCITTPNSTSEFCYSCALLPPYFANGTATPVDDGQASCPLSSSTPVPTDDNFPTIPPGTITTIPDPTPGPDYDGSPGYSFDYCGQGGKTCAPTHTCYSISSNASTLCQDYQTEQECVCLSTDYSNVFCSNSTECLSGDRCAQTNTSNAGYCFSCSSFDRLQSDLQLTPLDDGSANCDDGLKESPRPSFIPGPSPGSDSGNDGYTFDTCTATSMNCVYPRSCIHVSDDIGPCQSTDTECYCLSQDYFICTTSSDCLYGDRCYTSTSLASDVCLSCNTDIDLGLSPVDSASFNCEPEASPNMETPTPTGDSGFVYSYEYCSPYYDYCVDPRTCVSAMTGLTCQSGESACYCFSSENNICTTSLDCLNGDRCATITGVTSKTICVSCNIFYSSTESVQFVDNGAGNCFPYSTYTPIIYPSPSPFVYE